MTNEHTEQSEREELIRELTECLPTMEDGPDALTWCSVRGDHLRKAAAMLAADKAVGDVAKDWKNERPDHFAPFGRNADGSAQGLE